MNIRLMGFWSAISTTLFGLLYIFALILTLAGILPKPWDTFWQLLPSIFLAWTYLALIACFYMNATDEKRIFALVGFGVSIIYATINTIVYFTILTIVVPGMLAGRTSELEILLFEPGRFLFNINGIAYTLMSLAALLTSFSYANNGDEKKLKWSMIAHGLVGPFIVGAVLWAPLTYVGALWIFTFPALGIVSIRYFAQNIKSLKR